MYAIVFTGGKQYKVAKDDVIEIEKLPAEVGDKVNLDVLFLADGDKIVVDAAALAKATVTAEIIDQFKGEKQLVFKFKKRKGYKKLRGHRQKLTRVRIIDISTAAPKAAKKTTTKSTEASKADAASE
ncbi:MAG: 50S ribosomal protein L21 [Actinobacteria bacterium]|nr:50S ribosomal protein L21 [Actinomycetota bacterium]